MPVEFSVGAYRFGHSMACPSYKINEVARKQTEVAGVHRIPLFEPEAKVRESLAGFQELPDQWTVQWQFFLPGIAEAPGLPQPSYKIDAELANPLGKLPVAIAAPQVIGLNLSEELARVLAARNLFRGSDSGCPAAKTWRRRWGSNRSATKSSSTARPSRKRPAKTWPVVRRCGSTC
jgi:hypothetical protein